jgi:4-diphosphocytidyl-2-C-methyl-D-erythritol kinase
VSAALVEQASAKINLTLRVLGRRADGYHELESLVAFADVGDTLTLQPGADLALDISGPFGVACGSLAENLVLKAVAALRERVPRIKSGHFRLEKKLPVAAGIGGGSADAAAALRLLARANDLALDDARLASAALAVGADVPVCLDPKARVMRGIGELLTQPVDVPPLPVVLVNPGTPLATRDVFARLSLGDGGRKPLGDVPGEFEAMIAFLEQYGNDLTPPAIACAKVVAEMMEALRALPAVRLSRMSGSGPTCFALFASAGEAGAAARRLQAERKDWWVHAATVG